MHLMVLGASRLRADHLQSVWKLVSMHLMVLGASRLVVDTNWRIWIHWSQCTWWCWVLPDPRRVVRCPAWGNGPRIATGPKAPLGPGSTPLIEPGFAQLSQGSPPTGLQGLRATRCRRGHADPAAVPCSSNTSVQTRATNREALARRPPGGRRRASSQDWAPQPFPLGEATTVPPQGPWWPGTVGVACLARPLQAGQGGEHGDRVVDEAPAGPGHRRDGFGADRLELSVREVARGGVADEPGVYAPFAAQHVVE